MTADIDTAAAAVPSPGTPGPSRRGAAANGSHPTDLHELQQAMEAMRAGDFSVRLPAGRDGPLGRIAVLFNEIVAANQRMAQQLERMGKSVGEQGRTRQRVKFGISDRRLGRHGGLGQHADRRSAVADHRGDARDRRGGPGRPLADHARWTSTAGR